MNPVTRLGSRRGAALVTVMCIVFALCIAMATIVASSSQQTYMAQKLTDRTRALAIAEAGAAETYTKLATNFQLRYTPAAFPDRLYAGGTYKVGVTPVSNNAALICSTGTYGIASESVMLDLRDFSATPTGTSGGPTGAFAYAVCSGSTLGISGSGTLDLNGAKVHANNKVTMTGSAEIEGDLSSSVSIKMTGSTVVDGDATAPSISDSGAGSITGTKTIDAVPLVTIPQLDFTAYKKWAFDHGAYYTSDQHFTGSSDLVPPGGIMYVEGDLTISGSGNAIGCFICTGDLKISGSGSQIKVAGYPALVSLNGDIDISGSGDLHGLIYAKTGDFGKSGSGQVVGSIICNGTFDKSGSWDQMVYEDSTPVAPGTSSSTNNIGVSAWQR